MIAQADPAAVVHAIDAIMAGLAALRAAFAPLVPQEELGHQKAHVPEVRDTSPQGKDARRDYERNRKRDYRARKRAERQRKAAERYRALLEAERTATTIVPDMSRDMSRDTSVSTSSLRSEVDDDEGEARARENDGVAQLPAVDAERVATAVEAIVRDTGHWPKGGWPHAGTVAAVQHHLAAGISPAIITDAVRAAAQRAPAAPIHSVAYFQRPIERAHRDAMAPQLTLPLPPTPISRGNHERQREANRSHHRGTGGSAAQAQRRRVEQLLAAGALQSA